MFGITISSLSFWDIRLPRWPGLFVFFNNCMCDLLSTNFFGSLHECLYQFLSLFLHIRAPSCHVIDSFSGQSDDGTVARKLGPVGEESLNVTLQKPWSFLQKTNALAVIPSKVMRNSRIRSKVTMA